jgi:hypothetical protein
MSNVALSGNASGTGTFTIASPNSNTDRTLNLPDASGTLANTDASGNLLVGTTTNTNSSRIVSNGVIESTTGGVRFPDGTTQTTAAAVPTTHGAVGTYTIAFTPSTYGNGAGLTAGNTVAGSGLRQFTATGGTFSAVGQYATGGGSTAIGLSGTWRLMMNLSSAIGSGADPLGGLWLRIS